MCADFVGNDFCSDYVSNAEVLGEAKEADASLPDGLYEACLKTGRTPTAGEVKMMYYTKVRLLVLHVNLVRRDMK